MFIQEAEAVSATPLQLAGAFGFGMLIGWYVYYINRYRKGDVKFSDLSTVIGILGGGAVLALFPAKSDLFGAYGVGLAVGFFSYFGFLLLWVRISKNFNVDWFLDGRRKKLAKNEIAPDIRSTVTAMGADDENKDEFE